MGRSNTRPNHVSRGPGPEPDTDLLYDLDTGLILDRHSKYGKKAMKKLRKRCSDPGSRIIEH